MMMTLLFVGRTAGHFSKPHIYIYIYLTIYKSMEDVEERGTEGQKIKK